ncbi:hypothetical protein [Salibacterium sp. K-3]
MSEKSKLVSRVHLIYLSILFAITTIAILTISVWHDENTSAGLNNAATAASIVLAVVAIVMTLVDVAGQRKNIAEIKETADKLEETMKVASEQLNDVNELREEMLEAIEEVRLQNVEQNNEQIQHIKELISKINYEDDQSAQYKEHLNQMLNMLAKNNETNDLSGSINVSSNQQKIDIEEEIIQMAYKHFGYTPFTLRDLGKVTIYEGQRYTRSLLKNVLKNLVSQNKMDIINGIMYRLKE